MKYQLAIISVLLQSFSISGQVFDMMYQPGLSARATDAVHYDGKTFLTVISEIPGSFFATTSLLKIDDLGNVMDQQTFFIPGNEIAFWQRIGSLNDTLLLAGVTSPGCDFGPFTGMLTAWFNDSILWNRVYYSSDSMDGEISMIVDLAVGDSTLLLTDGTKLLWTDHSGEMIESIQLPLLSFIRGIRPTTNGYCISVNIGLMVFSEAADTLAIWNSEDVIDAIERPDGSFLLLLNDGIQELTADLEVIGDLIPMAIEANASIHILDTMSVVITGDSTFIFNGTNELLWSFALEEPDGFARSRSRIQNGTIITPGTFSSGVTGAACRSLSIEGELPTDVPELELLAITLDSISYSLTQPPNGPIMFSAAASFQVELRNNGSDTIASATLNSLIPYGICSYSGTRIEFNGLDLPPNETILLDAGPFQFFEYEYGTDSIDASLCIWATSPNHRLDRNRNNDDQCLSIPIPLNVIDRPPLRSYVIHPNPFEDRIEITPYLDPGTSVDLCDMTGRSIRSIQVISNNGTELFIPDLPRGTYLLSIINKEHRAVQKVIRY